MGKKEPAKEEEDTPAPEKEEEDTPAIASLKGIDDAYCKAEAAMELEVAKLRQQYIARQVLLLEERSKILSDASVCKPEDKDGGTPGCPEFWGDALTNCESFAELIEECDVPVLKYLQNIKTSNLDPDFQQKGCRIEFIFAENPYFSNTSLWVEVSRDYNNETSRPWKEDEVLEIKCSDIDWKPGNNITMAKSKPAASKKGKKKPAKAKEEPCPSLFRGLFTAFKRSDAAFPSGLRCCYEGMPVDDDDMIDGHLGAMGSICDFLHTELVPYAVRYYTGEACDGDDDDDDDDEESEEESGEDDDGDDDDSDDEPPAPKKKGGKKSPEIKPKAAPGGGANAKAEECKQQ